MPFGMKTELILELPEEIRRKIWQDWVIQGWKDALVKELKDCFTWEWWQQHICAKEDEPFFRTLYWCQAKNLEEFSPYLEEFEQNNKHAFLY